LVATQADALDAATEVARCHGLAVITRGTNVEGEARDIAIVEADLAREIATRSAPSVILGGGELTVTLGTYGSGGANREYALALALALGGHPSVWGLAADTDGIDGTDDGAGAIVTPDTLARARKLEIDPQAALADHDSGAFFSALGDTIVTGPTRTNVSDFRAILVEPHRSA
jgi:hydroxypyruvate reductase